ncbi:MAG TPA: DUF4258 domain-containing protein [Phnomibacter sp.]|nr:DUF4258 domain-containing protein [Phnomibacter sp.]
MTTIRRSKRANRWAPVVALVLLTIALLVVKWLKPTTPRAEPEQPAETRGLNRNPKALEISRHAACRMNCRKISQQEVEQILQEGRINYSKSEIGTNPDCKRKYAVEGTTADGQRVRIIFAPCKDKVTVVTVIDLGKEWACNCN